MSKPGSNPLATFPRRLLAGSGIFILCATLSAISLAVESSPPTTAPAAEGQSASDPSLQWLLSQTTEDAAGKDATTTQPAETSSDPVNATPAAEPPAPTSPFAQAAPNGRPALIHLSDGSQLLGQLDTTPGKPIRLWDSQAKGYRDIPFALIASIQAQVVWERLQPEWHFAASGSDLKEYTGKSYPDRELDYVLTLVNGQTLTGGIVAPLYFRSDTLSKTLTLNKRDKGPVGQTLDELVYIQSVEFDPAPSSTAPATSMPHAADEASTPLPSTQPARD